jgi:hypothetical protein
MFNRKASHIPGRLFLRVVAREHPLKKIFCPPSPKPLQSHFFHNTAQSAFTLTMGTGKKEANRKIRQGKVGDGMANVKTKGENFYRYCPTSAADGLYLLIQLSQICEEGQDSEHVQRGESCSQCCGKSHTSCLVPKSTSTTSKN